MTSPATNRALATTLQELLGYLNLSSGGADPQFLANINELYRAIEPEYSELCESWRTARRLLSERLCELQAGSSAAFRNTEQASGVLSLVFDQVIPAYRNFHRDLLFHQTDGDLWRPFFVARVLQVVLQQGPPWNEPDRIVPAAIAQLNDFIGHRPVAVLQSDQRMEPYSHEWIAPIPLFVREAGVAAGRYAALLEQSLAILRSTDPVLLNAAYFDPELLDEVALDPRAYDFDHPVNKRPNYHFGQWDPHRIDNQGRYRRFILEQVTLDALLERTLQPDDPHREETLFEAAAVLSGTILMASGTSGGGPDAHDSTVTLGTLLPRIARYRDAFYKQLLERTTGRLGERLRAEALSGRQPFAGARQYLNHYLARRRAAQLEHVHLALLFARMGQPEAAARQAHVVPVASARITSEIQCRLTTAHAAIESDQLDAALRLSSEIEDFLHRGIECGALSDPWNMLGFQGQFSLFPSPENSVPDHRADDLIDLVSQTFGLYARLWSEAAARDRAAIERAVDKAMSALARWWDQFATTTVESVESFSGTEAYSSARHVAEALKAWHRAGAGAGDIAFWRGHVQSFNSPKAYALVVDALLEKQDFVAAMALLVQWLSRAADVPLKQKEHAFHDRALRWIDTVVAAKRLSSCDAAPDAPRLVCKFFDYLEANAEEYWHVPRLEVQASGNHHDETLDEDDEDESNVFSAAYEDVVFKDSASDGFEGEMIEFGAPPSDFELEHEARRIRRRLRFLATLARLWKAAALPGGTCSAAPPGTIETLQRWLEQAEVNQRQLLELLRAVDRQKIPAPTASRDSLLEYDRRRSVKEGLQETIISTMVEMADAGRLLQALCTSAESVKAQPAILAVWRGLLTANASEVERRWSDFIIDVRQRPLLYIPVSKGGDPQRITEARRLQGTIRDLLRWLPRLGLLSEACELIAAARAMETEHPVGSGAVSEFDRLFDAGYQALVESLVEISNHWTSPGADDSTVDSELVDALELLTESLLKQWLAHSRTLRLSVLERIGDERSWQALVAFIERYGHDLFTQRFLNPSNLRAILHQGVDTWLARLEEDPDSQGSLKLLEDLDHQLSREEAVQCLGLVIEAIVENYAEYRDYNNTTTQSDRGELLYMLLDFLRLRMQYDRVAWNLKPVMLAHEILVRRGRLEAAELWRQSLAERTTDVADSLERRLSELRTKYGMRLPTVADRLAERFVRPLVIDRIRALVAPAIAEVRRGAPHEAFAALEAEIEELTQVPTGSGLDVPAWLQALEDEVARVHRAATQAGPCEDGVPPIPQTLLSCEEVQRQLRQWESSE